LPFAAFPLLICNPPWGGFTHQYHRYDCGK
jgi:hypothetical protein